MKSGCVGLMCEFCCSFWEMMCKKERESIACILVGDGSKLMRHVLPKSCRSKTFSYPPGRRKSSTDSQRSSADSITVTNDASETHSSHKKMKKK